MSKKPPFSIARLMRTFVSYLLIFVVMYTAINLWRAPSAPDAPTLGLAKTGVPDALAASHEAPVLVYFWGTWCHICSITSPSVQALKDSGYQVLGVAVSSGDDEALNTYMRTQGYDFNIINDADGQIFRQWQGQITPSYAIIKDGKITQSFTGIAPLWSLKLRMWWS